MDVPAIAAVDRLADLPDGWDSYGAPRVEEGARQVAKDCLKQIQYVLGTRYMNPVVGPTPEGGVALIWRKERGSEIDLLCSPNGARYLILSEGRQVVGQSEQPFRDCGDFAMQVLKRLDL